MERVYSSDLNVQEALGSYELTAASANCTPWCTAVAIATETGS